MNVGLILCCNSSGREECNQVTVFMQSAAGSRFNLLLLFRHIPVTAGDREGRLSTVTSQSC